MQVIEAQRASILKPHDHLHISHERMSGCGSLAPARRLLDTRLSPPLRVIMNDMAYCELCEMDREFCEHGLAERRGNATAAARELLISPNGMAHFPGCPHKGDDPDYSRWASLDTPRAWERLGNGEQLQATGGGRPGLLASTRCQDCVAHGPW